MEDTEDDEQPETLRARLDTFHDVYSYPFFLRLLYGARVFIDGLAFGLSRLLAAFERSCRRLLTLWGAHSEKQGRISVLLCSHASSYLFSCIVHCARACTSEATADTSTVRVRFGTFHHHPPS